MIRKPVAIIVGLTLLLGGLFKCDAFSQEVPIPEPPPIPMPEPPPISEPSLLPDEYTILCVPEKATGFNWENGDWVATHFKLIKRLVVKSPKNYCLSWGEMTTDSFSEDVYMDVCLNVREFGQTYKRTASRICAEHYIKKSGIWETSIYCSDSPRITLKPDGQYHFSQITDDVSDNPKDDYKASMVVEVGKCSMIAP